MGAQAVHGERHEVLRAGERHGPLQVRGHDPGQRGGGVEEEQLPPEVGGLSVPEAITQIVKIAFDCRPGAIAKSLQLREPKYQITAAYGHFGRKSYTENGMKFFEWENAMD